MVLLYFCRRSPFGTSALNRNQRKRRFGHDRVTDVFVPQRGNVCKRWDCFCARCDMKRVASLLQKGKMLPRLIVDGQNVRYGVCYSKLSVPLRACRHGNGKRHVCFAGREKLLYTELESHKRRDRTCGRGEGTKGGESPIAIGST